MYKLKNLKVRNKPIRVERQKIDSVKDFTENEKLYMLNFCLKHENKPICIKEIAKLFNHIFFKKIRY